MCACIKRPSVQLHLCSLHFHPVKIKFLRLQVLQYQEVGFKLKMRWHLKVAVSAAGLGRAVSEALYGVVVHE